MRTSGPILRLSSVLVVAMLALAGCGSTNGGESSSGKVASNAPAWLKTAAANVNAGYKGEATGAPPAGPKAPTGKRLTFISCGQSLPACASAAANFTAAAKALGWTTNVVDAKSDLSIASQGIEQAVAQKVDGIGIYSFDCGALKNALQKARDAKIPVVSTFSQDCNPSLLSITTIGNLPPFSAYDLLSKLKVDWLMTRTQGKAKVIAIEQTDLDATAATEKDFEGELAKCTTCKVVDTVKFTLSTFSNLQSLVSAALAKHPEANAVWVPYGGVLGGGAQAAIAQSGRVKSLHVLSGTCVDGEIGLIKQGWDIICGAYDDQSSWMQIDYLNRLMHGVAPDALPKVGVAFQMIDKQHNLPSGDTWKNPVDYQADYLKIWGR